MATARVPRISAKQQVPTGKQLIGYEEAVATLNEDQAFKATVYAMNTLLIQKGYYSPEEFRFQFRQSAQKQIKKTGG
jgi:hypothetical protein